MKTRTQITHFIDSQLTEPLGRLYDQRLFLYIPVVIRAILRLASLAIFFSIFFAFFRMFFSEMEGFGAVFSYIFIGIFCLAGGIIGYSMANKGIIPQVVKVMPALERGPLKHGFIVLVLALAVLGLWQINVWVFPTMELGPGFLLHFVKLIGIVIGLTILSGLVGWPLRRYQGKYRKDVVPMIIKYLLPEAQFEAKGMVPRQFFEANSIFPTDDIVRYTGSNLIKDPAESPLRFWSEAKVTNKSVTQRPGKTRVEILPVFKGVLVVCPVPDLSPALRLHRPGRFTDEVADRMNTWQQRYGNAGWEIRDDRTHRVPEGYQLLLPKDVGRIQLASEFRTLLRLLAEWIPSQIDVQVQHGKLLIALAGFKGFLQTNLSGELVSVDDLEYFQRFWESLQGLSRVVE